MIHLSPRLALCSGHGAWVSAMQITNLLMLLHEAGSQCPRPRPPLGAHSKVKLRQTARRNFVGHRAVLSPLDVIVQEAHVAPGGTIIRVEMGGPHRGSTCSGNAAVTPATRGSKH